MNVEHKISQYLAEFIGTFFLVFFGCGSMVLAQVIPGYDAGFVPIIFGGAVAAMIYATGHISGAHFNPAVTLAFWSTGKFPIQRVTGYFIAQISGATSASVIHKVILGSSHDFGKTIVSGSVGGGFLTEVILSFVLMFVIISVATDSRAEGEQAAIAIGTTVALCAFVGGPLTRASMNPARSIGPAILGMDFSQLWLYILAPFVGTVFGAKIYEWIRGCKETDSKDKHGCC